MTNACGMSGMHLLQLLRDVGEGAGGGGVDQRKRFVWLDAAGQGRGDHVN